MVILSKDEYIWLKPKGTGEFAVPVGARVLNINGNHADVIDDDGEKSTITMDDSIQVMHKSIAAGTADMIDLGELSEGSILRNLFIRYKDAKIYTYIGSILIAVNPYRQLPIYGNDYITKYKNKELNENEPHIYAISDNAYRDMMNFDRDETIIISGESGSGKTESTKLFLKYLAYSSGQHSWIEQQILDSNPILEAFGNAKTVRNDNSSRFGKYIDITFDKDGHILKAEILQYLLEKSRIVSQDSNERNYHIFYSMLAGLSSDKKQHIGLAGNTSFNYLQKDSMAVKGRDELVEWDSVLSAFKVMQISDDSVDNICRLLASVLLIGQIDYAESKSKSGEGVTLRDSKIVDIASSVMMVDPTSFKKALTHKSIMVSNQLVVKDVNREQAVDIRDAFTKSVYGKMFEWIVAEINRAISKEVTVKEIRRFGILDIFGFESIGTNSFEQLCINYTNERLQQFFVHHVFKIEQNEYDHENINWTKIKFSDNMEIIDFIALQKLNILSLIDEETIFPKGTDKSFTEKLFNVHGKSKYLSRDPSKKVDSISFILKHFAGDIIYSSKNFLEKNRDTHSLDFQQVLAKAANPFIHQIYGNNMDKLAGSSMRKTLGNQFKQSMEELMQTMAIRNPYFIRCLKPNENKSDNEFDRPLIAKQLRYSGMMETITIRRAGYPIRHLFRDFVPRYYLILKASTPYRQGMNDAELSSHICAKALKKEDYQIGKTKVFLKDAGNTDMEKARHDVLSESIIEIQAIIRNWANQKTFARIRNATVCVQSFYRNSEQQRSYAKMRRGFMRLQSIYHSELVSKRYDSLSTNIPKLQQLCRDHLMKNVNQRMVLTAMAFQEEVRRYLATREAQSVLMKKEEIRQAEKKRDEQERKLARTVGPVKAKEEANKRLEIVLTEITNSFEILESFEKSEIEKKKTAIERINMKRHEVLTEQEIVDRAFKSIFDNESLENEQNKEDIELDLAEFKFVVFAKRNFENKATPSHTGNVLPSPLLKQHNKLYEMAAISSWIMLLKFMGDIKIKKQKSKMKDQPVSEFLMKNVASRIMVDDQTELNRIAEEYKNTELNEKALTKVSFLPKVELTPFESIQYIVGLGVIIRELRDEIYCQVMKQLTANDSVENFAKGWILLLIMTAFFAPSDKLLKYLKSFLKSGPKAYGKVAIGQLNRVIKNGQRNGAPTHFESRAMKAKKPLEISVTLMDDSVVNIYIDSTTIGKEAVGSIAAKLKIQDIYGFGVRASVFGTSEIIYDTDHILDAVESCEAYALKVGVPLSSMPIKFFLVKVFFPPWSIPYDDTTAVRLIYQQLLRGIKYGEYVCENEQEHTYYAVQAYFADVGPKLTLGDFDAFLPKISNETDLQSKRSRQYYLKAFQETFVQLVPEIKANFGDSEEGREKVRTSMVNEMKYRWPIKFSRFIPNVDISGPTLSDEDTTLVMTWKSINLSRDNNIIFTFNYPEIVELSPVRPHDNKRTKQSFTVVTPMSNFVLSSPKAEELRNTIKEFLDNLKMKSSYAMAIKDHEPEGRGAGTLALRRGDLVMLYADEDGKRVVKDGFMEGENDRNGREGRFPADSVYIIPASDKPGAHVMESIAVLAFKDISDYLYADELSKDIFPEWEKYAIRNIGSRKTGKKTWSGRDQRLITYQNTPLRNPLLTEILFDENSGSPLKTLAVTALQCFRAILQYGQLPRKGFKRGYCQGIIDEVFGPCLAKAPTEDNSNLLRDEVYCQIMKQLMFTPTKEIYDRMWELMWLAGGLFIPRKELFEVILHFLKTRDNKMADSCVNRMMSVKEKGKRKLPPTMLEVDTAQKHAYRMFHLVTLPDESQERIEVTCVSKVKDLEERLGSRLNISSPEEFSLMIRTKTETLMIPTTEYYFDFIRMLSGRVLGTTTRREAIDLRFAFELIYVRLLWINVKPGENIHTDIAFHYPQETQKYLQGYYNVTVDDAVELAALIYRAKFGEDSSRFGFLSREFRNYVPKDMSDKLDAETWTARIEDTYLERENMSPDAAKVDIVRMLFRFPQFGTSYISVKQTTNARFPRDIVISINKKGVAIIDAATKNELASAGYTKQMEWRVTRGQFNFTLNSNTRILCETNQEERLVELISAYKNSLEEDENEPPTISEPAKNTDLDAQPSSNYEYSQLSPTPIGTEDPFSAYSRALSNAAASGAQPNAGIFGNALRNSLATSGSPAYPEPKPEQPDSLNDLSSDAIDDQLELLRQRFRPAAADNPNVSQERPSFRKPPPQRFSEEF